jgi:hypothetical protein
MQVDVAMPHWNRMFIVHAFKRLHIQSLDHHLKYDKFRRILDKIQLLSFRFIILYVNLWNEMHKEEEA